MELIHEYNTIEAELIRPGMIVTTLFQRYQMSWVEGVVVDVDLTEPGIVAVKFRAHRSYARHTDNYAESSCVEYGDDTSTTEYFVTGQPLGVVNYDEYDIIDGPNGTIKFEAKSAPVPVVASNENGGLSIGVPSDAVTVTADDLEAMFRRPAFGAVESGFVESDEQPEKLITVDDVEPGMDVRLNYRGELIEGTIDSAFDHDDTHMSLGIALSDRDIIKCVIMRGTDPVIWVR